jgi:mono/diheme cytochrome c family protein
MKAMFAALLLAAGLYGADHPTPPWEARSHVGRDLYREHCAVCHDVDKTKKDSRKIGPSLNHLFQNETLPLSKAKPTRDFVVVKIKFGGQLMPAFMKKMSDAEVNALVNYLETK